MIFQTPWHTLRSFSKHLRKYFADHTGDALALVHSTRQQHLRGDSQVGDCQPLGHVLEILLILASSSWEQKHDEVRLRQLADGVHTLRWFVARHVAHQRLC